MTAISYSVSCKDLRLNLLSLAGRLESMGLDIFRVFVHWKKRCRLLANKRLLGNTVHFEVARGNDQENDDYCTKDGDVLLRASESQKVCEVLEKILPTEKLLCSLMSSLAAESCFPCSQITQLMKLRTSSMVELYRTFDDVRRTIFERPTTLYLWQRHLLSELLGAPHPRQILWYVDHAGNSGKHLCPECWSAMENVAGGVWEEL